MIVLLLFVNFDLSQIFLDYSRLEEFEYNLNNLIDFLQVVNNKYYYPKIYKNPLTLIH